MKYKSLMLFLSISISMHAQDMVSLSHNDVILENEKSIEDTIIFMGNN
jgi:hypothetical protein